MSAIRTALSQLGNALVWTVRYHAWNSPYDSAPCRGYAAEVARQADRMARALAAAKARGESA